MRAWGLFDSLLPAKLGIEVDFVDITDLGAVRHAVRPSTRLIHTEVIANPDLRVADISALTSIAHAAGARLTVDSTFTPPPLLRPLDLGADLTIHSLTKYFNGHGDAMGGAVIGSTGLVEEIRTGALHHAGGAISPFNAWLIMRGTVTLPLRVARQCATAQKVAEFLAADPRIAHVAYPGLSGDPGHQRAQAQLHGGFGGLVSFAIASTHQDRVRFVNDLRVITSAVSLGHDETLIAYEEYPEARAALSTHPSANTASSGWPLGWSPPTICSPISTPPSTPPSAPPGPTGQESNRATGRAPAGPWAPGVA
jgi:methionine-gamma-lyase